MHIVEIELADIYDDCIVYIYHFPFGFGITECICMILIKINDHCTYVCLVCLDMMLILVKNLDGKTVSVRVESSSDTVASVKAKLEELEGIPPQHQNLLYSSSRILRDGHKLSD